MEHRKNPPATGIADGREGERNTASMHVHRHDSTKERILQSKNRDIGGIVDSIFEARSKEEVHDLRYESNNPQFRKEILDAHGNACANCGKTNDIELHHIVPLSVGGTNAISNVIPLCRECHRSIHFHKKSWEQHIHSSKTIGRPRCQECVPAYETIIEDYLRCRITKRDAAILLNVGCWNHLSERVWFKEYLRKTGVSEYKNNLSLLTNHNGELVDGQHIGYIVRNGKREDFFWESPGDVQIIS